MKNKSVKDIITCMFPLLSGKKYFPSNSEACLHLCLISYKWIMHLSLNVHWPRRMDYRIALEQTWLIGYIWIRNPSFPSAPWPNIWGEISAILVRKMREMALELVIYRSELLLGYNNYVFVNMHELQAHPDNWMLQNGKILRKPF